MPPSSALIRSIAAKLLPKKETPAASTRPPAVDHPTNSLLGLPLELIHKILHHLQGDRKVLLCASSANSTLRAFILPLVVTRVSISASQASITLLQEIIPQSSSFLLLIKILEIRGDNQWPLKNAAIDTLLHCRAVKSLNIQTPFFHSNHQLYRLLAGYPDLKELFMEAWPRSVAPDWHDMFGRRLPNLRLQKLTLNGDSLISNDRSQDISYFSLIEFLEDAKVTKTLEDVMLWCTDPFEHVLVQKILDWDMPRARSIVLDTVGSRVNPGPAAEQWEYLWRIRRHLTSSNPYIFLTLRLRGISEEVNTAVTFLQHVKIPTIRAISLLFDEASRFTVEGAAPRDKRKFVFKPEPGKPKFDPTPFPALEHIQVVFVHSLGVSGVRHIRDRFSRAISQGVAVAFLCCQ